MGWLAGLAQVGLGVYNAIDSSSKAKKAEAKADKLAREAANYTPSQQAQEALSFTESELANGMNARTMQAYENSVDKGLSTSLSAILKGGGNVNDIGSLYGASGEGRNKLAIIKDSLRLNQINNYLSANTAYGQENQTAWQMKYQQGANAMEATGIARQQAEQSKANGIGMAVGGLMNAGQQYQEQKNFDNYLNRRYPQQTQDVINPNSLEYSRPTNYVAQDNPVSFDNSANNDLAWLNPTDVYGNSYNPAPVRPM